MQQLWAPWRMTYIGKDAPREPGCFFCNAWRDTGNEKKHLLLGRGDKCFVMFNRYPYASAHLLIAPARHVGDMLDVTPEEGAELWRLTTLCKKAISQTLHPHGFNIGINQGAEAGAGVVEHLHVHIVPRWSGDVNFMPVFADVKVLPQALEETYDILKPVFAELL